MSSALQNIRNNALVLFFAILCAVLALSAALPQKAFAAAELTLSAASSTSNNASTTLAKTGNTVTFGILLSGTPWGLGSSTINIFNLGSTTMLTPTNAQGAYWTYSTTSNASNWTEGPITYYISWGNTDGTATSTTFFTGGVVYDKTAPTGSASAGSYINRAASTTASISISGGEYGATYLYYLGTGLASTSGSGTLTGSSQSITGVDVHSLAEGTLTLAIALTDAAGNKGATTTSSTILDVTVPADAGAAPGSGAYTTAQTVTLTSSGSSSFHYTLGVTTPADPTCSTGNTTSGTISIETSQVLKVLACDAAGNPSGVSTYTYNIGSGGSSHHSSGGGGGSSHSSTPSTPASSSGSGLSSSQVSSILTLLTSFGADASVIAKVQASLNGTAVPSMPGTPSVSFVRDLTVGSSGADVMALQQFLNTHGSMISSSGPGSPGNETMLFGALTKAALARYQAAHGIAPAAGYFGPKTRAAVMGM